MDRKMASNKALGVVKMLLMLLVAPICSARKFDACDLDECEKLWIKRQPHMLIVSRPACYLDWNSIMSRQRKSAY